MERKSSEITGICVLITNPNGSVVSYGADFDRCRFGGFSLEESQRVRAMRKAKITFATAHLNEWMGAVVTEHFANAFWEHAEKANYRMEIVPVSAHGDTQAMAGEL